MKKKLKKKTVISIVIIFIVLGVGFLKVSWSIKGLEVEKKVLKTEFYEKQYVEEGTVVSKNSMKIYSSSSGTVSDILKNDGEMGERGEVIVKLSSDELFYNLEILEAKKLSLIGQKNAELQSTKDSDLNVQKKSIEIAKNKKENLEKDLLAQQKLYDAGAISDDKLRDSQTAYDNAVKELSIENYKYNTLQSSLKLTSGRKQYYENEIKAIDLEIENIKETIEDTNIKAPIEGIISNFELSKGDYISKNQFMFKIFDPNYYEIETYVLVKESKNIMEGMEAYLEIDENNSLKNVKCEIISISKTAKELTSTLGLKEKKVKVILTPVEEVELINGENVDVKFITYKKENAQVVSKDHVFPWKDGDGIWIIENGRSKIINVIKEFETSSFIILKENFPEDTEIIIPPYPEKLKEEIKVY